MRIPKTPFKQSFAEKAKLLLLMIAPLILSFSISAQNENCCYLGRQCTTDAEWASGYYDFHSGQCAEPSQQQQSTASQSPPQGGKSENVNNCCYVDRQCSTDEEWASGYLAYQENQCAATADSEPQSESRESASKEGNNCCYSGWECNTDEDWRSGYWAYQYNQCESPSQWPKQWSKVKQLQRKSSTQTQDPVKHTYDPYTGKHVFTYSDGIEIIARKPTKEELCEAIPESCDD